MTKKRKILLIFGTLGMVALLVFLYNSDKQRLDSEDPTSTTPSTDSPFLRPSDPSTPSNNTQRPSTSDSEYEPDLSVPYTPQEPAYQMKILDRTASYTIIHYPSDDSYQIIIERTPFDISRVSAEQQFMQRMKMSREEVCELNVFITTPSYVSEEYAGQTLPLSYCN